RLHPATGVENELLRQPAAARAQVANDLDAAGLRIDLRLQEFISDEVSISQSHLWPRRRVGRRRLREPGETQSGDLDRQMGGAGGELRGLDRPLDRHWPGESGQFQTDATVEPTGVQQ